MESKERVRLMRGADTLVVVHNEAEGGKNTEGNSNIANAGMRGNRREIDGE